MKEDRVEGLARAILLCRSGFTTWEQFAEWRHANPREYPDWEADAREDALAALSYLETDSQERIIELRKLPLTEDRAELISGLSALVVGVRSFRETGE